MKSVNIGGHAAHRNALRKRLRVCCPNNHKVISESQRGIYKKFRDLDLSPVDSIVEDKYSVFSSKPRLPSCAFRSCLLSPAFHAPAVTAWADAMQVAPFYAILSGFASDDTPGIGMFYDFFDRLRDGPEKNLTNHIQPPRAKAKKAKNKGQKADSAETETTEEVIKRRSLADFLVDEQPYAALFSVFRACFPNQSVLRGVIRAVPPPFWETGRPSSPRENATVKSATAPTQAFSAALIRVSSRSRTATLAGILPVTFIIPAMACA